MKMTILGIRVPIHERVEIDGDEPDKPPIDYSVNLWDIIAPYFSIAFHIIDIVLDINVAIQYLMHDEFLYFILTSIFILVPAVINTAFSIRMYILDGRDSLSRKATKQSIFCIFILLFQLAPVLRYYESLQYARKCRQAEKNNDNAKQKKYYELMLKEDSDVALLRVIECFLEAAPQQILQITILLVTYGRGISMFSLIHNLGSIGSSFVSMAWSMASYHRTIRFAQKSKENICWKGTVMQFIWHILVTVSRILSISVLASVFPASTCIAVTVHWLSMTIWLNVTEKSNFCDHKKYLDFLFYSIFGLVYIFTYVALSDGKTKYKYLFFYLSCFIENIAASLIWFLTANDKLKAMIYFNPLIYCSTIPFILGIICMLLYYKCCHPTTKISSRKISALSINE